MNNIGRTYILLGLLWLLAGTIFGTWIGASDHLQYGDGHAHMNLLGFVTSSLFGLFFIIMPGMTRSKLAMPQLVLFQVGSVALVLGKILVTAGTTILPLLIGGSFAVIIGVILMLVILWQSSNMSN